MKNIKAILVAGAIACSGTLYAQAVPAPTPQPTTEQPAQTTPTQQPATQQNSETFNKPEAERAMNPVSAPLQQGGVIKDTLTPGRRSQTDSTRMNSRKGSGEMDSTKSGKKSKGKMKKRDER